MDPFKRRLMKGIVLAEIAAFAFSYRVYHGMNTSQEYRKWMHEKHPSVLNGFYNFAEFVSGETTVKYRDYKTWGLLDENDLLIETK